MLKVVCFKWKRNAEGFMLPAVCDYGPEHVLRLSRMVARFLKVPHEFICITDDPTGLESIKTIPLWDKCRDLGGCFNRLYVFSPDMRDLIGERFVCIDLDCVLTADVTSLFVRQTDFMMNSYQPMANERHKKDQVYNGGMFMMDAGARRQVWDTFDPKRSPQMVKDNPNVVGSDQAWIRMCLGAYEKTWGPGDGVYEARNIKSNLPTNAKIVFFAGKRDPSISRLSWVKEFYK